MPLPGHVVQWLDSGGASSQQSNDTRQAFIVCEADRGPLFPVKVTSLAQAMSPTLFGSRQSYSYLYDTLETAFAEGVPAVWISRIAATAGVAASLSLSNGTATTLTISAMGPGAYGNGLTVQIRTNADDAINIPAGFFQIRVAEGGVVIEDSPAFATEADALLWAPSSGTGAAQTFKLVDAVATGNPVQLAATSMASGADSRNTIADSDWQVAVDRFTMDLGPGQVAMPGQTTTSRQLMVVAHALARNRHAVLDMPDTITTATLTGAAAAVNAAPSKGARFASAYWPWVLVPAIAGGIGFRTVPPSAAMIGLMARAEAQGGDAGIAAAGEEHGVMRFVQGISQPVSTLSDATLTALDDAGINVFHEFFGIDNPVQYGNRTPRNRGSDALWAEASGSRLAMGIAAAGDLVMRKWVHRRISGSAALGQLQSELAQVLEPLRLRGALFGETPDEAYRVDAMSDAVNPPAQLQAGTLNAVISYRTSPSPERVVLSLARISITQTLGG